MSQRMFIIKTVMFVPLLVACGGFVGGGLVAGVMMLVNWILEFAAGRGTLFSDRSVVAGMYVGAIAGVGLAVFVAVRLALEAKSLDVRKTAAFPVEPNSDGNALDAINKGETWGRE